MSEQCAVPLCLPNNCKWDEQTGEYSKDGDVRESLCVVETALERLRSIKGRVPDGMNVGIGFASLDNTVYFQYQIKFYFFRQVKSEISL